MKAIKIIIILLVILFTFNSIYSQPITFKMVYPGVAAGDSYYNKIICSPFNNDKSFIITSPLLFKINSFGNVTKIKEFINIGGSKNSFIFNNNAAFTLFGNGGYNKNLSKIDTSLNVIFAKNYNKINGPFSGNDRNIINSTFEKGFILSGGKLDTTLFVKTDSLGNIIMSKYFTPIQGGIQDIVQTQDSGFVFAANLRNLGACLIKTDSAGTVMWCKSYFRPRGFVHSLTKNSDGTLMITGSIDSIGLNKIYYLSTSPLFVIKISQNGNVIWAKEYNEATNGIRTWPSQIKHTQDSGYIIIATLAKPSQNDDLILIKTDVNGDTLWTRAHGSDSSFDCAQSIEQLNDKGYIIAGVTNDNLGGGTELYLIRSDSLGHTASRCEEYNLPISVNNITVNDSNISITAVPFTVTTSVADTSTQSFNIYAYDGCVLDNIKELMAEQTAPLVIYPNPSDGIYHIQINETGLYNISVYNSIGDIILVETEINQKTTIDLSNQPAGIYYVKVSEGNNIEHFKLIKR